MNNMNMTDKIEKFVTGKLSSEEMRDFSEQIQKDPLLENEVILQQDIINGISNHRKQELKSKLDSVSVNYSKWRGAKIAGATAALSLLFGLIIYNYVSQDEKELLRSNKINIVDQNTIEDKVVIEEQKRATEKKENLSGYQEHGIIEPHRIDEDKNYIENTPSEPVSQEPVADNTVEPLPVSELSKPQLPGNMADEEENIHSNDFEMPKDMSSDEVTEDVMSSIEDAKHLPSRNGKSLEYMYSGKSLVFYGIESKNAYELYDFNLSNGALYMSLDNKYYVIENKGKQIVPLTEINDKEVIEMIRKLEINR